MIIDTHTHFLDCTCLCPCEDGLPIETMVQTQDKFGIKEMWISSTGALAQDFEFYNKNMFEHTKEYADRFRNFATASPYFEQRAIDNIRKCIEQYGFKGIKVHHWMQGGSVHSSTTHKIMEMSIEYNVPVLFHDGTPPTSDTLQIAYLAGLYPEAKVILGHSGMFDTPKCAVEACNTYDNIFLCISCSTIQDAKMIFNNARPDRLLFGSDYGAADTEDVFTDRVDAIEYACDDEDLKKKIYYENAVKLVSD
jgi:predicted TIM-barrel fold metal-dependent hydrolase